MTEGKHWKGVSVDGKGFVQASCGFSRSRWQVLRVEPEKPREIAGGDLKFERAPQ